MLKKINGWTAINKLTDTVSFASCCLLTLFALNLIRLDTFLLTRLCHDMM